MSRGPEADVGESGAEGPESGRRHRGRAVERDAPATKVEARLLGSGHLPGTKVVCEVRTPTDVGSFLGDRLEPCRRTLDEGQRIEDHPASARIERLEHAADQSHVVVQRQPAHDR